MSERAIAILNPTAGGGRARRAWEALAPALAAEGLVPEVRLTEGPGAAIALTRQALAEGATLVFAIGGDGTANEVANGFFEGERASEARLAVIPAGSGNDLARALGLPTSAEAQARLAASGRARPIDVGLATFQDFEGRPVRRIFLNTFSLGIGVAALQRFRHYPAVLHNALGYALAGLSQITRHRVAPVRLTPGGEVAAAWVVVGNGPYFAGGMPGLPGAALDDGRLDLMVVTDGGPLARLGFMRSLLAGRHGEHPAVAMHRFETLGIETEAAIEVDGELLGRSPQTVKVLPGALRLVAP